MTMMISTPTTSAPAAQHALTVVPVLPESAPFSPAQRAWLNGFFAGMLGGHVATAAQGSVMAAAPTAAPAEQPIVQEEEQFPWHDPALTIDERLALAEGKSEERKLMAAMAQLDCGACGYICQTYGEAIARGEEKDLTRCTPGGRDTAKMLKQLAAAAKKIVPVSQVKVKKAAGAAVAPAPATDAPATFDRNSPYSARLLRSLPLNAAESSKDTRLVEIDLRGGGIHYKPGDALGVFPENRPELVSEVLEVLGLTGAEDVPGWDGLPMSLRDALLREFTITRPTPDLLDILSRCATDAVERDALQALRDSEDGTGDLHVLDLLRKFPSARPAAGDFVATLSPLAPRLYSISSSLKAHPGQVHLTVGAVRYANSLGRACEGVASTFLADRVRPGQTVRVFLHPSHKFGLPENDKPVIMVGPGTGIAPFRAFLEERAAASCKGRNWLFFGDQREAHDFLYRDELDAWQKSGVLTRLDTAFSRDSDKKVYVQHRMLEQGAELWKWLQEGAHFYVCGDAKRMASDVDKALRQVIIESGRLSAAEADKFVSDMVRSGRYQRDVY
jgi:sulfite reductase (NADPH) flavoprotein alpha-component